MFGGKGWKPEKEWDAHMKSFHASYPFLFDMFSQKEVDYFKPFAKEGIFC